MMNCYEVEITRSDGRGHKTTIWAESYRAALRLLEKEYGVGSDGIGCKLRIVQPKG